MTEPHATRTLQDVRFWKMFKIFPNSAEFKNPEEYRPGMKWARVSRGHIKWAVGPEGRVELYLCGHDRKTIMCVFMGNVSEAPIIHHQQESLANVRHYNIIALVFRALGGVPENVVIELTGQEPVNLSYFFRKPAKPVTQDRSHFN